MPWRKWLVRGLVFSIVGSLGVAAFLYQRWTNPLAIRQQVIAKLGAQLPGAVVGLESARLRLLGGIALYDLGLCRRDDRDRIEFAHVPSAVIFHDKEQLIDGKLAIRKVELHRPRLRVIRGSDGRWNVAGILGPTRLDIAIPTLVIRQGTILFEDALACSAQPLEIRDVNLTLLNDPLPTVSYRGTGKTELAGTVQISGSWQRATDALVLSLEAPALPLKPALIEWLSGHLPKLTEHARTLEGQARLQLELGYQPDNPRPWSHDLRCQLTQGSLHHPRIPLPLDHLEASIRCLDGELKLDSCTARSGPTKLNLSGWARMRGAKESGPNKAPTIEALTPDPDSLIPEGTDFEGDLKVEALAVSSDLFTQLPPRLRKLHTEYAPHGPIDLAYHFGRNSGHWKERCLVQPRDLSASFRKFPYTLEHLTGSLEQEIDNERHVDTLRVDLAGFAGPRRVFIKGNVIGEGPRPEVDIKIWGDDLVLDEKMHAALPAVHEKLARSFLPTGQVNFQALIRRTAGAAAFDNRYVLAFHHGSMRYDMFPYPLENVSVLLDIREDEHWEFHNFRGTHKGGEFWARGRSHPTPRGDRLALEIRGQNVLLDGELEAALKPELKKTWGVFQPSGRMNFVALVDCPPDKPQEPEVDVTVTALGCGIKPRFFPYVLHDLTGNFRYAKHWVHLHKLQARHGQTVLSVDEAKAYLKPDHGYWVDVSFLHGSPLVVDNDLVDALPPVLQDTCRAMRLRDPLGLKTHLIIDSVPEEDAPPIIFWDGEVSMRQASLYGGVPFEGVTGTAACRGRYNGKHLEGLVGNVLVAEATALRQPFRDIQTQIQLQKESKDSPERLVLPGLRARIFGGEVYGPISVEFGPNLKYEMNLTASNIQLEEFGRHNLGPKAPLGGLASARVYLSGQGSDLQNLQGRGSVDIPNGRLYHLPLLLDLFKFLRLRLPDGTAFEEARANFTITGQRVVVSRLDLYGNSVSLRGQGEMNLDGSDVNLEFYAVWARIIQMLPPVIKDIPPAFSKHLLKIKMRGRIGDVRCTNEPIPILVEPLKELLEAVSGRRR